MTKPESDEIQDMETDVAAEVQAEEAAEVRSPVNSDECDDGNSFGGWDDEF